MRELSPASLVVRAASISDAVQQLEAAGWQRDGTRWTRGDEWMESKHVEALWRADTAGRRRRGGAE